MNRILKTKREFEVTDLFNNTITFEDVYDVANYLDVSIPSVYGHARNKTPIKANNMLYTIKYKKYYV